MMISEKEGAKGRGFMKRVRERWNQKYPEQRDASWQKLRDNAARFKKELEIQNLILVRRRDKMQQEESQNKDFRQREIPPEQNQEAIVTEEEGIRIDVYWSSEREEREQVENIKED